MKTIVKEITIQVIGCKPGLVETVETLVCKETARQISVAASDLCVGSSPAATERPGKIAIWADIIYQEHGAGELCTFFTQLATSIMDQTGQGVRVKWNHPNGGVELANANAQHEQKAYA